MIPEAKKEIVANALQATFGTSVIEDITQLTTGLSTALIFRIVVLGNPYLLRIITRTDAMGDQTHHFTCLQPAATAGLAPAIRYMSFEDRILITDFVDAKPFPMKKAAELLPQTLKQLHALPPFPFRLNYLDMAYNFIQKLQDSNFLPTSTASIIFPRFEQLKKVYPRNDNDIVACHNDLKADNILFDGQRVWLVDWEGAFLNDRYVDLVVVANFVTRKNNEEVEYLTSYFGKAPNEYQLARFFLMQQLLHLFYGTFLLLLVAGEGATIDANMPRRGFGEFHDGMWNGEISLAGNDTRQEYAWIHLYQSQEELQSARFEDALRIVTDNPML